MTWAVPGQETCSPYQAAYHSACAWEPCRPSPSLISAIRFIRMKPHRVSGLMMSVSVSLVREGVIIQVAIHGCWLPVGRYTVRLSRRRWSARPQGVYRLTPPSPGLWILGTQIMHLERIDFKLLSPLLFNPSLLLNSFVQECLCALAPDSVFKRLWLKAENSQNSPFSPSESIRCELHFFSVFSLFQDP